MIEYAFEFFSPSDFNIQHATPFQDSQNYSQVIYQFNLNPTPALWMKAWGLEKPDVMHTAVQVFVRQFLVEVFSLVDLIASDNTFFQQANMIYMHIPVRPIKVPSELLVLYLSQQYSTNTFSTNNYSDALHFNRTYIPILKAPVISGQRLPESFSGAISTPQFSVTLYNQDGRFDNTDFTNYFNVPANIQRCDQAPKTIEDLKLIKRFYVDNISLNSKELHIFGKDLFNNFSDSIHRHYDQTTYMPEDEQHLNQAIPVAYGRINHIELVRLTDGRYVACDPIDSGLSEVFSVSDEKNNIKTFSVSDGLIAIEDAKPETTYFADIRGRDIQNMGKIIQDLYERTYKTTLSAGEWDTDEVLQYQSICCDINIFFEEETLKSAIEEVLKNDMAFLIQKNNGTLTLRRYGETYQVHSIAEKTLLPSFQKTYQNSRNYLTKASIFYDFDYKTQTHLSRHNNFENDQELYIKYKKSKDLSEPLKTNIIFKNDAEFLSNLIIERFGKKLEIVSILTSKTLFDVNILDRIIINIMLNNRRVSGKMVFNVIAVDPAGSKLTLESVN